jgi:hypothetical protein
MTVTGGRVRTESVARIRKMLRENPGATVRTFRGDDGRVQLSLDRLSQLKRRVRLTELKADAETRFSHATGRAP